jgi:hypothetical protein
MALRTFVDTSGFYALLVSKDDRHHAARDFLATAARQGALFVTSDYVLDETATLLKARGHAHILPELFDSILNSRACRIEWLDSNRFSRTHAMFLRHDDKDWSFTDCSSFVLMKELRIRQALTKDEHFIQAGFISLLACPKK